MFRSRSWICSFNLTGELSDIVFDTRRARIAAVGLLLLVHVVLFPAYGAQPVNEDAWVLPGPDEFTATPDAYVGDRVATTGIVETTSPLVLRVTTTRGPQRITIVGFAATPDVGDKVRVYGTLTEPGRIDAHNGFVVPQRGSWYAWGISFLAGLWVLARLLRHWTVDIKTLGFRPRAEPLTVSRVIGRVTTREVETDA